MNRTCSFVHYGYSKYLPQFPCHTLLGHLPPALTDLPTKFSILSVCLQKSRCSFCFCSSSTSHHSVHEGWIRVHRRTATKLHRWDMDSHRRTEQYIVNNPASMVQSSPVGPSGFVRRFAIEADKEKRGTVSRCLMVASRIWSSSGRVAGTDLSVAAEDNDGDDDCHCQEKFIKWQQWRWNGCDNGWECARGILGQSSSIEGRKRGAGKWGHDNNFTVTKTLSEGRRTDARRRRTHLLLRWRPNNNDDNAAFASTSTEPLGL